MKKKPHFCDAHINAIKLHFLDALETQIIRCESFISLQQIPMEVCLDFAVGKAAIEHAKRKIREEVSDMKSKKPMPKPAKGKKKMPEKMAKGKAKPKPKKNIEDTEV